MNDAKESNKTAKILFLMENNTWQIGSNHIIQHPEYIIIIVNLLSGWTKMLPKCMFGVHKVNL